MATSKKKFSYYIVIIFTAFLLFSCNSFSSTASHNSTPKTSINDIILDETNEEIKEIQKELDDLSLSKPAMPKVESFSIQTDFYHIPNKDITFQLTGSFPSDCEVNVYSIPFDSSWLSDHIIWNSSHEILLESTPFPNDISLKETWVFSQYKYPYILPALPSGLYCLEFLSGMQQVLVPILVTSVLSIPIEQGSSCKFWIYDTKSKSSLRNYDFFDSVGTKFTTDQYGVLSVDVQENKTYALFSHDKIFAGILCHLEDCWKTDRLDYTPGEEIILYTTQSAISPSMTLYTDTEYIECNNIPTEQGILRFQIPNTIKPNLYTMQLSTGQSQQINIIDDAKPIQEHLLVSKQFVQPKETIEVKLLTTSLKKEATVQVYSVDSSKVIDSQTRLLKNHSASFYFMLEKPGLYRIKSHSSDVLIAVQGIQVTQNQIFPTVLSKNDDILYSVYNTDGLYVIHDINKVIQYQQIKPKDTIQSTISSYFTNVDANIIRVHDHIATIQTFLLPRIDSKQIHIASLSEPWKKDGTNIKMAWAESKKFSDFLEYNISSLVSKGISQVLSYKQETWQKKKIIRNIIQARESFQIEDYNQTIASCLNILQDNENYNPAKVMMQESWNKLYPPEKELILPYSSNIMDRLAYITIKESWKNLSLEEFFSKLSLETGIYIECHPDINTQLFRIPTLPANESALDLLEYVLTTSKLVAKQEQGILAITTPKHANDSVLESIDQFYSKPVVKQTKQQALKIFPTNYNASEISFSFPYSAIWFVHIFSFSQKNLIHTIEIVLVPEETTTK